MVIASAPAISTKTRNVRGVVAFLGVLVLKTKIKKGIRKKEEKAVCISI